MNKAIFFDVDNTLVCREQNKITKSTMEAIHKLKNQQINIAIATGRSLAMVKQETFHQMFSTIISANGSLITINDEVIYKNYLPKHKVRELITSFEQAGAPYCLHLLHESKGKIEDEWIKHFSKKYNMPISELETDILDKLDECEIFQINAYISDKDIELVKKRYPQFSFVKLIDVEEGYDIFNKKCSKGSAIQYLKKLESNKKVKYYAFGDGFNDLEMFEEVDYSIAMGNGCEALKQRASYVTDHINENGVYNALKHLNLI